MFGWAAEFQPDEARVGFVYGEVDAEEVSLTGSGFVSEVGDLGAECFVGVCVAGLACFGAVGHAVAGAAVEGCGLVTYTT